MAAGLGYGDTQAQVNGSEMGSTAKKSGPCGHIWNIGFCSGAVLAVCALCCAVCWHWAVEPQP